MSWILITLLVVVLAFVLVSPLESLRWWSSRGEEEVRSSFEIVPGHEVRALPAGQEEPHRFAVYLSGIGVLAGNELADREQALLQAVKDEIPGLVVVDDVFPYSVDNRGLTQRATMWLWKRLDKIRRRRSFNPLPFLIQLRNVSHVLVSADPRYGPTHSIGLAQEIWRSLQRHGYQPGSGVPVTIIGYSGGGQMGLGAGWFLAGLGIPVSLISIGGVFADDPGLDRMEHIFDLYGTKDAIRWLGPIAFPGRWPTAPLSRWGRAKRENRVTTTVIGSMAHDGANGYFGRRKKGADGRAHADVTRQAVVEILGSAPQG